MAVIQAQVRQVRSALLLPPPLQWIKNAAMDIEVQQPSKQQGIVLLFYASVHPLSSLSMSERQYDGIGTLCRRRRDQ